MKTKSSNYTVRPGLLEKLSPSCKLKNKKKEQQRDIVCSPLKLCHYLSYGHSPGRKTISGCLYSTWKISQGYKLARLPSFTLRQCLKKE